MRISIIPLIGAALVLAACGSATVEGEGVPTTSPTTTEARPSTTVAPAAVSSSDDARVDDAIADLASRLDVAADAITVVSVESRIWSDGSLGCPQPGSPYTQAQVPGYLVILELDGSEYRYHGADGESPTLCDDRIATGEPRPRP